MEITYNDIISFLERKTISYSLKGNKFDSYKVSSIFYPEKNSFYFYKNSIPLPDTISQSLILTDNLKLQINEGNGILYIKEDPQEIFYELLNFYFKEKSTGKICSSAIIDKAAIIGENVQIDSFVKIGKCIIGENCIIKSNVVINDETVVKSNSVIEPNCTIGATGMAWILNNRGDRIKLPQLGGVEIAENCIIGANSVIVRGSLNEKTQLGSNTVIAPGARIGHGCQIGKNVHFANNVVLGGNTLIGDSCFLGSSAVSRPKIKLHSYTVVGAGAVVVKNTSKENLTLMGVPAKEYDNKNNLSGVPQIKK